MDQGVETDVEDGRSRAAWVGLLLALGITAVAFAIPPLTGWEVYPRSTVSPDNIAPLHGLWEPKLFGPGTLPTLVLAVLGWCYLPALAERLAWRRLMWVCFGAGLAWLLALALVDGVSGLTRVLGTRFEYLPTALGVTDVHATLQEFISRIPYAAAPDNWPTHVAGHPPGALLFFVVLDRVGLGGSLASALVVTVIAATVAPAVLTTLRALQREDLARQAAPFLVLTPAAVFMAVSADAVFAAVAAWGMACLALAAVSASRRGTVGWAVLAGLLLGYTVMMSYGLPLLGVLAVAVLLAARRWLPLPVAVLSALAVVLGFAVAGFAWWEAYPVLRTRYYEGIAKHRPFAYWSWANLACLSVSAGPLVAAGLARVAALRSRADRVLLLLVGAGAAMVLAADVSDMSKGEVERIWLPFIPWLTLAVVVLPPRWRRAGLALQLVTAVVVQQLFYTSW